jgi:transcriptional regulator with XRE-family HTH domain
MERIAKLFADNLRFFRNERKWTQEALSERLSLSPITVSNYESGRRWPEPETISAIAAAFGISPDQLFMDRKSRLKPTIQEALDVVSEAALAGEQSSPSASIPEPVRELIALTSSLNEKEMSHLLDTIRAFLVDTRGPQSGTVLHTFHAPQKKSKR